MRAIGGVCFVLLVLAPDGVRAQPPLPPRIPLPKPAPFQIPSPPMAKPLAIPKPNFPPALPVAAPPVRPFQAKPGQNMPALAAAKPAPPKPTLSAPEPTIKTVRNDTLARVNVLDKAVAAAKNPSVARAAAVLSSQQLDWPTPAAPAAPGLAGNLADAMKLGSPNQKLLPQLAAFNDALSGPPAMQRQGALALLKAAGKPAPKDAELDKMLADAQAAHKAASADSQHGEMSAGKDKIDIDSSPSTGTAQVSVYQTGADGKPERVTITGQDKSVVNAAGDNIQTQLQTQPPQVVSSKQSDDMRSQVNGIWTDQDGLVWEVAGQGDAITFTQQMKGGHKITYVGNWKLGLPYASHLVNDVADMDDVLPGDVKEQLADSYHPPFAVRLTYLADKATFTGLWISGEVTYSGMFHTVKLVNDPTWDKPLVLTRSGLKVAQGGRYPEDGL